MTWKKRKAPKIRKSGIRGSAKQAIRNGEVRYNQKKEQWEEKVDG